MLFTDELRSGRVASWNPYSSGGMPLAATPNYALASPISLPYFLLPAWLAPAYEKLLELAVAIAGCFLFLRRLRLGRPAALLGGLVFAASAFMVVWTGWTQTRVAAVIPLVFWAIERLVQRRRAADAALLSLAVAALLLGGFPSVAAFTLLTAAGYLVVRAIAERIPTLIAGGVAGMIGGASLAAWQLLPFADFLRTWLVQGRAQTPADHLSPAALVTAVAPYAFGDVSGRANPRWYLADNMVEALSYVGAAAVVLTIVALAAPRAGRSLLPRATWVFLVAAAGGWAMLIYGGGPVLALLQHAPVFDANAIGRARSVLGFLLAALAAAGFEIVLRHRGAIAGRRRWWGAGVWTAAIAAGGLACLAGLHTARSTPALAAGRVAQLERQVLIAAALVVITVACVLVLMSDRARRVRLAAAVLIPLLVAGQALSLVLPYYPRVPRDTFYPTTEVHAYLAAHLGHDRFAGTTNAMIMGADAPKRLRALTGHGFINARFAAMVRGVPGNPIPYPTYVNLRADPAVAASPVLDRLAVRYLVASPRDPVIGTARDVPGDGGAVTLTPDNPVAAAVPGTGPVRAVGLTPLRPPSGTADPQARVEVVVRDANGVTVARAQRLLLRVTGGRPFLVPVAMPAVPASARLTATFTLRGTAPLTIAARGTPPMARMPAVSTVMPADDGLTIAHAGSAVVYERLTALPRIRWAAQAVVEPDADRRVALLAAGRVGPDQVLLDAPGATGDGRPAYLRIDDDGTDRIAVSVRAAGAGYLVVADADQVGWVAEVDGRPASLLPADQGVVAVAVPAGVHTVRLSFSPPDHNLGTGLTLLTLFILVAVTVYPRAARVTPRHRRG
jgi:hypothetical protein